VDYRLVRDDRERSWRRGRGVTLRAMRVAAGGIGRSLESADPG
jgi:hypothetical protein